MDVMYLLLFLTRVTCVVLQTCREVQLRELVHHYKRIPFQISCLVNLSLEQCALECLLVKICKSFNYIKRNEKYWRHNYMTLCELNDKNLHDVGQGYLEHREQYVYFDIRTWPKEVAGTCAHRPCAENQRCLPATSYRCITIDCGDPPTAYRMIHLPTNASLGSVAYFKCIDNKQGVAVTAGDELICLHNLYRICNSDSTWTVNDMFCKI